MPNATEKAPVIPIDTVPEEVREAFMQRYWERLSWISRAQKAEQANEILALQIREMQADARHSRVVRRQRNKRVSTFLVICAAGYLAGLAWDWWTL